MEDDLASVAWSSASETERLMFTVLSNVDRVDLAAIPRPGAEGDGGLQPSPRIEELPRIEEERAPAPPPPPAAAAPPEDRPLAFHSPPRAPDEPPPPRAPDEPPPRAPDEPPPPPREEEPPPRPAEEPPRPPADAPYPPPLDPPPPAAAPIAEAPPPAPPEPPRMDPEEEELEKRSVLLDLQRFEQQGVRLTRAWTTADRLEDMTLELRRIVLAMDERSNVNMMRDGLRMLVTGIEMVSNRFHILDLEGWSSDVCQDLNRFDTSLGRIYRKYWRRSTSNSPEGEIAFALLGSLGMHHMKRTMTKQMLSGGAGRRGAGPAGGAFPRRRPASPDTSDDEQPPPRRA